MLVVLGGVCFRLTSYGDLQLSIATLDTDSYMQSSHAPVLSWQAFIGQRLFTTNLLYRFARAGDCPVQALSNPALGKESRRKAQSCFESVVLVQTLFSVLGWGLLILSVSSELRSNFSRLAAAIVLTAFAFTPQIADWDSILASEAITFSLFAASLGLVIQAPRSIRAAGKNGGPSTARIALTLLATVTLALWSLARDSNVYTLLIFCLMALPFVVLGHPRRMATAAGIFALLAVCLIGLVSSMQSGRWRTPLTGAFEEFIQPYPARVQGLQNLGMPSPTSSTYAQWFDQHGETTYVLFLLTHPGFVANTIINHTGSLFANNNQPYFKTPDLPARNAALSIGDLVHSRSSSVLVVDVLIVLAFGLIAARLREPNLVGWTWILVWLLISAIATLVLTFFADPVGVERHVVFSLVLFRLLMWLGLLVLIDVAARPGKESADT
jgi:hypothetical protein